MDIDPRIAKFISSQQMESSEILKRIIDLGESLVEELGLEPGTDTLSRWMAHYVAEQMEVAKTVTGDKKVEAEVQCFETILKIWQHRSSLPNGHRPFEKFESVFNVLERLNPENNRPYYFNLETDKTSKDNESVQQWLDIALDIDHAVRIWLDYVFRQAALCAIDENTKEWIEKSFFLKKNDDASIIMSLLSDAILSSRDVPDEIIKMKNSELISARIKKLESYNDFNQKLLSTLRKELAELSEDVSTVGKEDLS